MSQPAPTEDRKSEGWNMNQSFKQVNDSWVCFNDFRCRLLDLDQGLGGKMIHLVLSVQFCICLALPKKAMTIRARDSGIKNLRLPALFAPR
jgi:hypothetical protein